MAVLANGGKNFGRNPTLEALGRFELGAEDQSVEAGLVDAVDRLDAVELVDDFRLDEVFGINVIFDRFARVAYPSDEQMSTATKSGDSGAPRVRTALFSKENIVGIDIQVSYVFFNTAHTDANQWWADLRVGVPAHRNQPPEGARKPTQNSETARWHNDSLPHLVGTRNAYPMRSDNKKAARLNDRR